MSLPPPPSHTGFAGNFKKMQRNFQSESQRELAVDLSSFSAGYSAKYSGCNIFLLQRALHYFPVLLLRYSAHILINFFSKSPGSMGTGRKITRVAFLHRMAQDQVQEIKTLSTTHTPTPTHTHTHTHTYIIMMILKSTATTDTQ